MCIDTFALAWIMKVDSETTSNEPAAERERPITEKPNDLMKKERKKIKSHTPRAYTTKCGLWIMHVHEK